MKLIAVMLVVAGAALAYTVPAYAGDENTKVFVCKYVGTPGVDETLQTGQNPISVSVNATGGAAVGSFFNDAQGRSFVLAVDVGQDEPGVDQCPPPDNPPPVDVCPNLEGNQSEVPPGYHLGEDADGRSICIQDEPPVHVAAASVVCGEDGAFHVGGTIDGLTALVNILTIAGNFEGDTTITVTLGDLVRSVVVHTDGECGAGTPRGVATAGAVCNTTTHQYDVTGEVDGVAATVIPSTIPGGTSGTTLVAVFLFPEDVQLVLVNTAGTCLAVLPPPPPGTTGAASVTCDLGARLYRLSGTIDGLTADSVSPTTIPGSTKGSTNVTVTRGDTSFRTAVTTNGDCGPASGTTPTPGTLAPPTATPPVVATPTKPAAKPKPVRKPVAKKKVHKKVIVHKAKPKPTVHICKPVNGHSRVWVKTGPNKGCQYVGKPEPSTLTG